MYSRAAPGNAARWFMGPVSIFDPSRTRHSRLAVAALRAAGHESARIVTELPPVGTVIVLDDSLRAVVEAWAAERSADRAVVVDPRSTGLPTLHVGQRANAPSTAPRPGHDPGDAYLSDLVLIAFRAYATRLTHGRLPPGWFAYLEHAFDLLRRRAVDPSVVDAFAAQLLVGEARRDAGSTYLARGRFARFPRWPDRDDDPKTPLLRAALRVAAKNDETAWDEVLAHLDARRGLFRSARNAPPNAHQYHPVIVCAIARRLECFRPVSLEPVTFPDPANRGVLAHAALLCDVPDLVHSYDLEEYTVVPDLVEQVLGPSPAPASPTVALRHDVDRPLTAEDLGRHLELERKLGLRSTWYFKAETFDAERADTIRAGGNEVAYHADLLDTGDDGYLDRLTEWLGAAPGMTFHGGLGADAFRGRRSLVRAAELGVAYAEHLIGVRARPVLWPHEAGWLRLAPLPVKVDTFPDRVPAHLDAVARPGGLVIVENHPDLLPELYVQTLTRLAAMQPRALTVADALREAFPELPD